MGVKANRRASFAERLEGSPWHQVMSQCVKQHPLKMRSLHLAKSFDFTKESGTAAVLHFPPEYLKNDETCQNIIAAINDYKCYSTQTFIPLGLLSN